MLRVLSLFVILVTVLFAVVSAGGQTTVDNTFKAVPAKTSSETMIQQVVQPDGRVIVFAPKMVIGGVPRGDILRLNTDGSLDTTFNYCACALTSVTHVKLGTDGKIYVGGVVPTATKIVRLNSDGSIDSTFDPPAGSNSSQITLNTVQADGKVLATIRASYLGYTQISLYRFNTDGSQDAGFTPISIASGRAVWASVSIGTLPDGRFFLGNTSGSMGSVVTLTRRNADGTIDGAWNAPSFVSANSPSDVAISEISVVDDGSIYVAGRWNSVNGMQKSNLVHLLSAGNVDMNFGSPAVLRGTQVKALPTGKVFFSGNTDISGISKIFRLNADGTIDGTYSQDASVSSISNAWAADISQRVVFVGMTANGPMFMRLQGDGSLDASFAPSIDYYGTVSVLARQDDGKVLVAGEFTQMNGVARNGFARVNTDGTLDLTFNPGTGFSSVPNKIVVQGNKILAVGPFTAYNGTAVARIVRLNSDGSIDNTFSAGTDQEVLDISLQTDGRILIGGKFTQVNSTARTGAARLESNGTLDASFAPVIGNWGIYQIMQEPGNKIIVAGSFSGVNGFNRSNFVRLNIDGSLDQTFNASVGTVGKVIRQSDGKYVIGIGAPVFQLDRRNADGTDDPSFTPDYIDVPSGNVKVREIVLQPDGSLLIAGRFDTVGGRPRRNFARLAPNGKADALFSLSGADEEIKALIADEPEKLVAGGDFSTIFDVSKPGIARLNIGQYRAKTNFDFDGDGRADFTVYRPSTGNWYELFSNNNGYTAPVFGLPGDIPVPADYDGDGITDEAIFRPSDGYWWYRSSIDNAQRAAQYGMAGDQPRPGDFDNDGKADYIVYRPSNNTWYRLGSTFGPVAPYVFGLPGDIAVIGDFDGDGKVDPAVFRPSSGDWWYAATSQSMLHRAMHWGANGDIPAPADFDGDGRADFAVFRPSTGVWYVYFSATNTWAIQAFGLNGDRPVPADYDGDGRADIAVFRPSTGIWYVSLSGGGLSGVQWGVSTDIAIPNAFLP
ncbi:MAG: VCBS repeat-containing protein [Chloracidobacterium sp.]|nr:VCBS repeat-containing protein [Chloracidobacterium sp.]MCO5333002.1 FG-GAP-like repeat-containing protein [Pyrinomonadaceae bacterium]